MRRGSTGDEWKSRVLAEIDRREAKVRKSRVG
jgi:hypothetical protein